MAILQQRMAKAETPARANDLGVRLRKSIPAYLFILPGLLLFLSWTMYPLLYSLVMSFANWNLIKPSTFIGFDNYTRAFHDPLFWGALGNTLFYVVVTVPGQMILGLGLALLLDGPLRARAFFRTIFYIPVVTSWVVVSLIFLYIYNGQWLKASRLYVYCNYLQ